MNKSQDLYKKAKILIPGGTQLLSKRPELFLPDLWPAYYSKAKGLFTTEGYEVYIKLINYGEAIVIGKPVLSFVSFDSSVVCRSIPMSFNFENNNKQFVENVVFHFNAEGKIYNLGFSLSKIAINDIMSKDVWSEYDRIILINFLENYKTAYALKRLDYIEKVFSDDALIITGTVVMVKTKNENLYENNQIVRYNRYSKQQYIKHLTYSFNSKEYINIEFEKSRIRKAGKKGNIYGIQIKQNYYSSNYGDIGYLFLLVDLSVQNEPVIQVRTWQPTIGPNESVYGLGDF